MASFDLQLSVALRFCRAREAAPDMIKSPSATRKAMKKSGLRVAVDAAVRPQVRPAHVGSRDGRAPNSPLRFLDLTPTLHLAPEFRPFLRECGLL